MFKLDHVYPSFPKKNKKSGKRRRFPLFPAANAPPGGECGLSEDNRCGGARHRGHRHHSHVHHPHHHSITVCHTSAPLSQFPDPGFLVGIHISTPKPVCQPEIKVFGKKEKRARGGGPFLRKRHKESTASDCGQDLTVLRIHSSSSGKARSGGRGRRASKMPPSSRTASA